MRQDSLQDIGARLTHVRASRSQADHALALNVPLRTYQTYEQGKREPDLRTLLALAGLDWNLHWLLTGEGPQRKRANRVEESPAAPYGHRINASWLATASEVVDRALGDRWTPRSHYFDLVAAIYDQVSQGKPVREVLAAAQALADAVGAAPGDLTLDEQLVEHQRDSRDLELANDPDDAE